MSDVIQKEITLHKKPEEPSTQVSNESRVAFSESGETVSKLPAWANWFIDLGLNFPSGSGRRRSILLMSTPCDSAAAGLVALGVVLRDLAREEANDERGYADAVRAYAAHSLRCMRCNSRCNPDLVGCGYVTEVTGVIYGQPPPGKTNRRRLLVESLDGELLTLVAPPGGSSVRHRRDAGCRDKLGPGCGGDAGFKQYQPEDWAALATPDNKPPISEAAFSLLRPRWKPYEINLKRSYSSACLVGRRAGDRATRKFLETTGFILNKQYFPLSSMLTISGWGGEDSVSRLRYFSTRGKAEFDRAGPAPEIAVVDGAAELTEILGERDRFERTQLIAVVPRDSQADKLEALAFALGELDRHYSVEPYLGPVTPPPAGVSAIWRIPCS